MMKNLEVIIAVMPACMNRMRMGGIMIDHHVINWNAPSSAAKRGAGVGETSSKAPPPRKFIWKNLSCEKIQIFLNWHEPFS